MRDECVAEHFGGEFFDLFHRLCDAHPAFRTRSLLLEATLAASAGMDLRLHHLERSAHFLGALLCFVRREGGGALSATGAPYAFRIAFAWYSWMFIAGVRLYATNAHASAGWMRVHASQRARTASTDLSNIALSLRSRSISMIRSTPPAPMTTGTPT